MLQANNRLMTLPMFLKAPEAGTLFLIVWDLKKALLLLNAQRQIYLPNVFLLQCRLRLSLYLRVELLLLTPAVGKLFRAKE
jgi:hypothetical protein